MNIRYFLFMSLGVERAYLPTHLRDMPNLEKKMSEPNGSRNCRRNILALAGVLILAGLSGADPHDLNVFGVKPSGERGVWVIAAGAIVVQVYWFVMRYHHLTEDGTVPARSGTDGGALKTTSKLSENERLVRKDADLWANRAAVVLAPLSWVVIALWICGVRFGTPFADPFDTDAIIRWIPAAAAQISAGGPWYP